jgi:hypothetical protein
MGNDSKQAPSKSRLDVLSATHCSARSFVVVPKCFEGEELERLQCSWRRAQRPAREQFETWRETGAKVDLPHGKLWFDIPVETLLAEAESDGGDPILLQLLGPQALLPVLDKIVGSPELCGVQPRTLAP